MNTRKTFLKIVIAIYCFLTLPVSLFAKTDFNTDLKIKKMRVEYHENPLGIDVTNPRLSWILEASGENMKQSAYRIIVSTSKEKVQNEIGDSWDSGKINSDSTNHVEYNGKPLQANQTYYWRVKIWDGGGNEAAFSETAFWSMGSLSYQDWKGKFIGHKMDYNRGDKFKELYLPPARYLRKSFSISKALKRATAYTTGLGLYEFTLNGSKVSDAYFLPGWTDYRKRLYYHTYDVTEQLQIGENVAGAVIADGWYAGYLGYALLVKLDKVREFYGVNPSFMGQIVLEYEDGTSEIIATDLSWKSSKGPILEADILMGETYDARLEKEGWDNVGYDDSAWAKPVIYTFPDGGLQAYPGTTVKIRERIVPNTITAPKPGTYVFDMGKNFAGTAKLQVKGLRGTKIQLKFGEILRRDGTVMTENLRLARATDTYILKGAGVETWQPKFTYHGFQYVEVTGLPNRPDENTITGLPMSSINTDAGTFSTSNAMNNTLFENIKTTQEANFFEIPTDCPQRDERLGWTGDAHIYMRSATYNADVAAFMTKFLIDLDDAQRWYGAYPNFAPFPYSQELQYSPAWMDAGIIIPYNMLKVYNDTRIVEQMYPGMTKFMRFQEQASNGYLRPGGGRNWGDWLAVGEETSHDFIASSFYGYDAQLMAEMAKAIGKTEDANTYHSLFQNIQKAFAAKYIKENGHITEDTQTSYALALYFNLYPSHLAKKGAARLAEKIKNNDYKFTTGFLGTKHVMLVLSQYGYHDIAYKLFKQTDYPSWGYSVKNGSTSIWERWNSYTEDDSQNSEINASMNSFSHYAFGSVAEWVFLQGLGIDTEDYGYRKIRIKPSISKEVDFMRGSYESINGKIASAWRWKGKKLIMDISIPANTTAKIHLPTDQRKNIKMNGKKISEQNNVKIIGEQANEVVIATGSGDFSFEIKN